MRHRLDALVVDDRAEGRRALGHRLAEAGFAIVYAEDGIDALRTFVQAEPDLIVTDVQMPRLSGIALVRRIREISDVPVVVMAESGSIPDCEEALRNGADRYLQLQRDLERVGEVARELVSGRPPRAGAGRRARRRGSITAAQARSLARQELREELQTHLLECRGNIAEIARRMGRDRSTVRYHLRKLGMLRSESSHAACPGKENGLR